MKNKTSRNIIIFSVVIGILICCLIICLIILLPTISHSTKSFLATSTPIVITHEDNSQVDGIILDILNVRRLNVYNEPDLQGIIIDMDIQSINVPWTGFDFKNTEWILIDEYGNRQSAQDARPLCVIYDNATCHQHITFALPIATSNVTLYYISDIRLDHIEPIEVEDTSDMRFVATMILENLGFELTPLSIPSATPTITNTPRPSSTPTAVRTNTPTVTPLLSKTPTSEMVITATPVSSATRPSIPSVIDVPSLLGKSVAEVENVLGDSVLVIPNDDNDDNLAGGEYRDYQIGNYYVFFGFDRTGISRMFQVLEGLDSRNYSISQWDQILPLFGLDINTPPDRTAAAAVYWDNYNGLFIAVVASSSSGRPVWTVQIAQAAYRP